jgi:hypothetical protein
VTRRGTILAHHWKLRRLRQVARTVGGSEEAAFMKSDQTASVGRPPRSADGCDSHPASGELEAKCRHQAREIEHARRGGVRLRARRERSEGREHRAGRRKRSAAPPPALSVSPRRPRGWPARESRGSRQRWGDRAAAFGPAQRCGHGPVSGAGAQRTLGDSTASLLAAPGVGAAPTRTADRACAGPRQSRPKLAARDRRQTESRAKRERRPHRRGKPTKGAS